MSWGTSTVSAREHLSGDNYRIVLHAPDIARTAVPGQFAEVATGGATLLNKPISIAAVDRAAGTISLVYKVVGPGTRAINAYAVGDRIGLIGPCGTGFTLNEPRACIVGGGIGIPPLLFLAAEYHQRTHFTCVLGARTAADLVLLDEFEELTGTAPMCATDDGSRGHHGLVVDCLKEAWQQGPIAVYACGPVAMLKCISALCVEAGVPCFVCLEAYMGCGIGVCMGCVIPTVRGMERVCAEGPVFAGADILWDEVR